MAKLMPTLALEATSTSRMKAVSWAKIVPPQRKPTVGVSSKAESRGASR
jgi:hypothetical protein